MIIPSRLFHYLTFIALLGSATPQLTATEPTPLRAALLEWESIPARPDVRRVADDLVTLVQAELSNEPGIFWVERSELNKLIAETDLAVSGRLSPRVSLRVGKLAQAQLLVTGRLDATDPAKTHLELEVVDLDHGDLLTSSLIALPERPHKHYTLREADHAVIINALRSVLTNAKSLHSTLATKPAVAILFLSNSGPSSRLDAAGTRLLANLQSSITHTGARVLNFPRARDAEKEQDLTILGLTETDDAVWQGVADLYAWGQYKEIPTDGIEFAQTPVEASFTLWDGTSPPRTIPWHGTITTFPEAEKAFSSAIQSAMRPQTNGSFSARAAAAQLLADQAASLARQHASSFASSDFWSSAIGLNFQKYRVLLLQSSAFFKPDDGSIRRALFDARWDYRAVTSDLTVTELWQRYSDRKLLSERFPRPESQISSTAYDKKLCIDDLQRIIDKLAEDLGGEKRLNLARIHDTATLWTKDVRDLNIWAQQHPSTGRSYADTLKSHATYLIGSDGIGFQNMGFAKRREMLDEVWPIITPVFRNWFDRLPEHANRIAATYVFTYAQFGEEDLAYKRLLKALEPTVDSPTDKHTSPNTTDKMDRPADSPEWSPAHPVQDYPALGPPLTLPSHVLYRWPGEQVSQKQSMRRLAYANGYNLRLLPADTIRLLGFDGRRLWVDGVLEPEADRTASPQLPQRRVSLLSPDTREFTEISDRLPGNSRAILAIFEEQNVHIGTDYEGLIRLGLEKEAATRITPEEGLPSLKIGSLTSYDGGFVVAATSPEQGLARFETATNRWLNMAVPNTRSRPTTMRGSPSANSLPQTLVAGLGPWILVGGEGLHLLDTRSNSWSADLGAIHDENANFTARIEEAFKAGEKEAIESLLEEGKSIPKWVTTHPSAIISDGNAFWIGGKFGLVRYDPTLPPSAAQVEECPPVLAIAETGRWIWITFAQEDKTGPNTQFPWGKSPYQLSYEKDTPPEWRQSKIALFDKVERRWHGSMSVSGGVTSLIATTGRLWAAGSTLVEFDTRSVAPFEPSTVHRPISDFAAKWCGLTELPLQNAIENLDHKLLTQLLSKGTPVEASGSEGWTALHLAAYHGDNKSIDLLLEAGANVNAFTHDGRNPLGLAASKGDLKTVHRLLAAGADPNRQARLHLARYPGFDPPGQSLPLAAPIQPYKSTVTLLPDSRVLVSWETIPEAGQDGFIIYRRDTPEDHVGYSQEGMRWNMLSPKYKSIGRIYYKVRSFVRTWIDDHPPAPGVTSTYTVIAVNQFDRYGPPSPVEAGNITIAPETRTPAGSYTFETQALSLDRTPLMLAAEAGHEKLVTNLLAAGADPMAVDSGGASAIHFAVANDHVQIAELLIKAHSPLNSVASQGWDLPKQLFSRQNLGLSFDSFDDVNGSYPKTVLQVCYERHQCEALFERLLQAGAAPGDLAVKAAMSGRVADIERLLAASPTPFVTDKYGHTVFTAALRYDRPQLARSLRERAFDPASPLWPDPEISPLAANAYMTAIYLRDLETMEWLLKRGASLAGTDIYKNLENAVKNRLPASFVRILVAAGADTENLPENLTSQVADPEVLAALTGRQPLIQKTAALLRFPDLSSIFFPVKYGAGPDKSSVKIDGTDLNSVLNSAAAGGDIKRIRESLKSGVQVDVRDERGWTALIHAIQAGHVEAARVLIDAGVSLNTLTDYGSSALAFAVALGNSEFIDELIDLGADPNLYSGKSASPLLFALGSDLNLARHLIKRGADPRILVHLGAYAADYVPLIFMAARCGNLPAVRLLVESGCDPKTILWRSKWQYGSTPSLHALHCAAASNDLNTLNYFLSLGLNPNLETAFGDNALDWAVDSAADKTAAKLRSLGLKTRKERGLAPMNN